LPVAKTINYVLRDVGHGLLIDHATSELHKRTLACINGMLFSNLLLRVGILALVLYTGWPKKVSHKCLSISLPNIYRFSKFFHCCILWKIY